MPRRLATLVLLLGVACSRGEVAQPALTSTSTLTSTTTSSTAPTAPTTATTRAAAAVPAGGLTAADLPSSWRPGCPVPPDQLRALRLEYWGFDGQSHTGTLVVHGSVAAAVTKVFVTLHRERFPIRSMQPVDAYGGDDERSLEADNTSGFNCRRAVASGPPRWSAHAYGKAIDVNPVENPYVEGGRVHPANGADYLERTPYRPGMAVADGPLVAAFATEAWQWGGRWSSTPDYQHFSTTGN